jgi:DNA-binding protein H-NS
MSETNLDRMSLSELKKLKKDVDKAIAGYVDRQRSAALAAAEAVAKEMGFVLADLVGLPEAKRSRAATAAKYQHPENPSLTWSGRGRRPDWIHDAVNAGQSLDDFLINN